MLVFSSLGGYYYHIYAASVIVRTVRTMSPGVYPGVCTFQAQKAWFSRSGACGGQIKAI